jgi:6-phosphogluconolactonase (cycloisomerase 2 family)
MRHALGLGLWLAVGLAGVAFAQGRFVYVNEQNDFSATRVFAFSVGADGALSAVPGSPFSGGGRGTMIGLTGANRIAVSTARNLLFAANEASADVSVFRIDPATGALALVAGSPFAAGFGASAGTSLAASNDGRFLFVTRLQAGAVSVFSVGRSGALAEVARQTFPFEFRPIHTAVTPDGRFFVASSIADHELLVFHIGADGHLTPVDGGLLAPVADAEPSGFSIGCSGDRLFVTLLASGTAIDSVDLGADGALARSAGSPFRGDDTHRTLVSVLARDDGFLYVLNSESNTIAGFAVGDGGVFTPVPGSPFASEGTFTYALATDASGTMLFATTQAPYTVVAYRIDETGALIRVPGSPVALDVVGSPNALATYPAPGCSAVTPAVTVCLVDDASGDAFSEVVDSASPRYGEWTYRVAATGAVLTGTADSVRFVAGKSLVSADADYSAENPSYSMTVQVKFGANRATVTVKRRHERERHRLADTDLRDDPGCP